MLLPWIQYQVVNLYLWIPWHCIPWPRVEFLSDTDITFCLWDLQQSRRSFRKFCWEQILSSRPLELPFSGLITWLIFSRFTARGLVSLGLTQEFPGIASSVKLELMIYCFNAIAPCCRAVWTAAIPPNITEAYLTWTMAIFLLVAFYIGWITVSFRAGRPTLTMALIIFLIYYHLSKQTCGR